MPYIIPKAEPTTPKSREALDQFGRELRKLDLGKLTKLTKEKFTNFVRDVHYDWFAQTSDVLRTRLVKYAKQNVDEIKPWFLAAQDIRPGFFRHPVEIWDVGARSSPETKHLCTEFDALVELGLIPSPNPAGTVQVATGEPRAPALVNTHFPNPYNSIPDEVIAKRPDLVGKTREEAWLSDLDQRDTEYRRFMGSVRQHLTQGVEALEVDNSPLTATFCEWLRDFLVQLEASTPENTFASVYNAAHGCIAVDANKSQAEALAKRLPVFRLPAGPATGATGGGTDKLNRGETPAFELPRLSTCSTVVDTPNHDVQRETIPLRRLPSLPRSGFSHSASSFEPVLPDRERSQRPETPASQGPEALSLPKPTPSGLGSRPVIVPITRSVLTRATSSGATHRPEESEDDHHRLEKRQRQD